MKVNTVEQFKVLEFIKSNFDTLEINVTIVDRYSLKVTDKEGQEITFKYHDNKVIWE